MATTSSLLVQNSWQRRSLAIWAAKSQIGLTDQTTHKVLLHQFVSFSISTGRFTPCSATLSWQILMLLRLNQSQRQNQRLHLFFLRVEYYPLIISSGMHPTTFACHLLSKIVYLDLTPKTSSHHHPLAPSLLFLPVTYHHLINYSISNSYHSLLLCLPIIVNYVRLGILLFCSFLHHYS